MLNMAMFWSKKKDKKPVDTDTVDNQSTALILPEDLKVTRDLGEGQYGVVQLGLWNPQNGTNPKYVAIKSLKNTSLDGVLKGVLEEALTMQRLSHDYIVKMYGISLPCKEEPLKLVTEYASHGSLEENLRKKDRDVCRVSALSKYAYQVAQGMDYLARQNLVHRDLSTRNILVFQPDLANDLYNDFKLTHFAFVVHPKFEALCTNIIPKLVRHTIEVKISDFGLARTLDGGAASQITLHRQLAVAWLPPEAIVNNVFTLWSDVWSYGITLWEMFSFGQQPWAELNLNQVMLMIANEPSKHLDKPEACPDGFYEIMLGCWERDPKMRPTFKYIDNKVLELQPREGITKVAHHTGEQDHLSYDSKMKATVISKKERGLLLVQSENGSIGLVQGKNLDFSKKALQKRASGRNAGDISRRFDLKKQNSTELLTKLHKGATNPTPSAKNRAVVEEDVTVQTPVTQTEESGVQRNLLDFRDDANSDPTNPLSPTRYAGNLATDHETIPQETKEGLQGATVDHVIAQNPPGDTSMGNGRGYMSMDYQQRNPAANEDQYATLKEVKGLQLLKKRQDFARAPRTMSESDIVGLASDEDYDVLHQTHTKDDTSLGRGLQEIPGANTPRRNSPPDIPGRPDLEEHTGIASGAAGSVLPASERPYSPFATTPRKTSKRPVPTPRRNIKPRPVSDGSLDKNADSGNKLLPGNEDFRARCNDETSKSSDARGVVDTSADKKESPPIPLSYKPTRTPLERQIAENTPVRSELRLEEQNGDDNELHVELQHQTSKVDTASEQPIKKKHYIIIGQPIPNGDGTAQAIAFQDSHGQDVPSESQAPSVDQVTGATGSSLSSQLMEDRHYVNADEVKRLSADIADISLNPEDEPIYDRPIQLPEPPDIPNEILNQPPPSPDKLFGGTFRGDLDPSFQLPPGGRVYNSAFQPLHQPSQLGNSPEEPVNPLDQPVHQTDQHVNPGGTTSGGAYGEEIDTGIREIREICGEEVQRDWCYAALLQFQGDVAQVVRVIKIQKLSKITGKSEPFCERTLSHCRWDLDRAASYIFENFEDKDV